MIKRDTIWRSKNGADDVIVTMIEREFNQVRCKSLRRSMIWPIELFLMRYEIKEDEHGVRIHDGINGVAT